MASRGLFQMRRGVPQAAHVRIAELFDGVRAGDVAPSDLKAEIDRWGLWDEYQDRFFALFRRGDASSSRGLWLPVTRTAGLGATRSRSAQPIGRS